MNIDNFGKIIEISDVKIKELFDTKYNKFNESNVSRNEFDQSALDFIELFLEDSFLIFLERLLVESVVFMNDIAYYKYFEKTPPFKKPINELYPDRYPQPYNPSKSVEKYMKKLGLSLIRDEELINKKLEELRQKDFAKLCNRNEKKKD